jgi:MFS family permease
MSAEFNIPQDNFPWLYWATASWNVGAAVFPLLFVPLTENIGRMPGYFASYIMFLIWLIPSATAPNFATLIVTRFFGGGASSVSINIVSGTLTDIWKGDRVLLGLRWGRLWGVRRRRILVGGGFIGYVLEGLDVRGLSLTRTTFSLHRSSSSQTQPCCPSSTSS